MRFSFIVIGFYVYLLASNLDDKDGVPAVSPVSTC